MSVSSLLLLRLLPLLAALRHEQKTLALTDTTDTEEKNVTIEVGEGDTRDTDEKNVTTEVGGGIDWGFASGRITG